MEIEESVDLFSVVDKGPVFGVVIFVDEREDHFFDVAGVRAGEVGGVDVIEGERLAVGGDAGLHARLVAHAAVMSQQQAASIQIEQADHIVRVVALDLAHHRGSPGDDLEADLQRLAVFALPFPGARHVLDGGEGFLGIGLGLGSERGGES